MFCLYHRPGLLLPVLGALPDSLIILVSGIGVPREVAQEQARAPSPLAMSSLRPSLDLFLLSLRNRHVCAFLLQCHLARLLFDVFLVCQRPARLLLELVP